MSRTLDVQGTWWLPDDDQHRVPGVLRWDLESGGQLTLNGTLRRDQLEEITDSAGNTQRVRTFTTSVNDKTYPVIHGQVRRTCYTLMDAFQTRLDDTWWGEEASEQVHVNALLEGTAWFTDANDMTFDRAVVDLRHLTAWIGRSGLATDQPRSRTGDSTEPWMVVTSTHAQSFVAPVGNAEIKLVHTLEPTGDRVHEIGVAQRWLMRIQHQEQQPIPSFIDVVSDMQDLVSIAMGDTAQIQSLGFEHPDVFEKSLAGTDFKSRATFDHLAQWADLAAKDERDKIRAYFTFDDFEGMVGVERWLAVAAEYRSELGRVMATRYNRSMFLEDRIMNVCAAIESFDKIRRATNDDVYYVERVRQCVAYAGPRFVPLLGGLDAPAWAERIKDLRHDLAHHRARLRTNTSPIEHVVSEQLYWLFVLCMLRLAEASEAALLRFERHGQITWLGERAAEAQ